jgi:3-keto-disaccharide hydrolase
MKKLKLILPVILGILILAYCSDFKEKSSGPVQGTTDVSAFAGQWTIDIEGGSVGWLEVRRENNYLDADILWEGGSVLPVSNIFLAKNCVLVIQRSNPVVRKTDALNNPVRTQEITDWLEITTSGDKIDGILLSPRADGSGVDTTSFTGKKLPDVPPAPDLKSLKYGAPISLFNGKDLNGWRLVNGKMVNGFKVVDGTLTNDPVQSEGQSHISYGNLRTDQVFEDFNLKLEVNVPQGNNSGVYLRGMYEIQVMDSYGKKTDPHNMGAVYSRITPSSAAEKPAGEWQTLDITLCKRHATVILNGVKIIDNQPIYGPTGGAIQSDVFAPGPIFLQGDHGKVSYRNILLTPIVY